MDRLKNERSEGERREVNRRIEWLRKSFRLSQPEFAKALGVKRSTVNNWESGDYNVKADTIELICRTFSCSADWLIGLTDEKNMTRDEIERQLSHYTGLSNVSVEFLRDIKKCAEKNPGGADSQTLLLINFLLDGDREEIFAFWDRLRLFMFTDGGDFNYVLGGGNTHVPRDAALRALLEMNNDFLQKEKDRLLAQKGEE